MNNSEAKVLPNCVGFIMDGNRRFAKEQGVTELAGHQIGKEKFLEVVEWVVEKEIPHAVFYAFSTENWKRDKTEIEHLMFLFREVLLQFKKEANERKVNVRVVGNLEDLPKDIQNEIKNLEKKADNHRTTIWVAISYGGRAEIVSAINKAIVLGEKIDEEKFSQLLWTAGMSDPDIIIRTSGEKRLSNFLPWQAVYSELFFIDTYWPAFTKPEFERILSEYAKRERRVGR